MTLFGKKKEIEEELIQKEVERKRKQTRRRVSPLFWIFLSFLMVVVIGWILLAIPFSWAEGHSLAPIDSLFLSVSAVCVTGLSPVVIADTLSLFGKIVMAFLIQVGGLGLVTIISFWLFLSGNNTSLSQANVIKEALNQNGLANIRKLIYHILLVTFSIEALGAFMSFFVFVKDYDPLTSLGFAVFHAISAFNNAGFDILGSTSLAAYKDNFLMNFTTCFLILAGGLGYLVYDDLFFRRTLTRASLQTKLVLIINAVTAVLSILAVYAVDYPRMSFLQAAFYGISLRTAGFTTFDSNLRTLSPGGVLVSCLFMFIGGNPLSTAGGMKTVTIFVTLYSLVSYATGRKMIIFKREISKETRLKALFLVVLGILDLLLGTVLICAFELGNENIVDTLRQDGGLGHGLVEAVFYEAASAFDTVGFTLGLTPLLGVPSKVVLCILMFTGRVGPVAVLTFWNPALSRPHKDRVSYVQTDLMIG